MAKVTAEELERLRVKKEQLEDRLKQLQQQQRRQNRKDETRYKIITGASFAAAVRDGVVSRKLLAYVLNRYVTKKNERRFMGLEPREEALKDEPEEVVEPQSVSAEDDDEVNAYEEGSQYLSDEELAEMGVVKPGREEQRGE